MACCCLASVCGPSARAQTTTALTEGLHGNPPRVHALINARLVIAPGKVVERGCLVLRDGLISEAGGDVQPPPDARVWDLSGRTVYAGFVDAYSRYGLAAKDRPLPLRPEKLGHPGPPAEKPAGAVAWNPLVTPQREAARLIEADEKQAEQWRALLLGEEADGGHPFLDGGVGRGFGPGFRAERRHERASRCGGKDLLEFLLGETAFEEVAHGLGREDYFRFSGLSERSALGMKSPSARMSLPSKWMVPPPYSGR